MKDVLYNYVYIKLASKEKAAPGVIDALGSLMRALGGFYKRHPVITTAPVAFATGLYWPRIVDFASKLKAQQTSPYYAINPDYYQH